MDGRARALASAALFVALGLVGAFVVSIVADRWDAGPRAAAGRSPNPGLDDPGSIRVEVLNGAGVAGLARDATRHLRGDGFDVVFFGNAAGFDHARSVVLDRTGGGGAARAVAAALGIDSVRTAVDSALLLEVTVVLGDDWPPAPASTLDWRDRLRAIVGRDDAPDSATSESAAFDSAAAGAGPPAPAPRPASDAG